MISGRELENARRFLPRHVHASGGDCHPYSRRHVDPFHCDLGSDLALHLPLVVRDRHVQITREKNVAAAKEPRVRQPGGENNRYTIGIDQRRGSNLYEAAHCRFSPRNSAVSQNCHAGEAAALSGYAESQTRSPVALFAGLAISLLRFCNRLHQPPHCNLYSVEFVKRHVSRAPRSVILRGLAARKSNASVRSKARRLASNSARIAGQFRFSVLSAARRQSPDQFQSAFRLRGRTARNQYGVLS